MNSRKFKPTIEEKYHAMQKSWENFLAKAETFRAQLEKEAAAAAAPLASVAVVQKTVSEFYEVPLSAMSAQSRVVRYSHPRQVAMMLCRELTNHTLEEIGGNFGGRDHGTVTHAVEAIQCRTQTQPAFRAQLETIRAACMEKVRTINEPLLAFGMRPLK